MRGGPVLVRGRFDVGPLGILFLLCAALAVCSVVARLLDRTDGPASIYFLTAGGLMSLCALAVLSWCVLRRRWLLATPTGFVLIGGGRAETFADGEVVGLTRSFRSSSSGGVAHRVTLELARRKLRLRYEVPLDAADPLARLWERLVSAAARRAASGLVGKRWRLDPHSLHHNGQAVPLGRVTKVAYVGPRLLVWKDDDEEAFLSLKASSRNALPLAEALWNHPDARRHQQLADNPLGRVLLVQRSLGWLVSAVLMAGMVPVGFGLFRDFDLGHLAALRFWYTRAPYLALVALTAAYFHHALTTRLAFHENGVSQPSRSGRLSLLLGEVETVIWFAGSNITVKPPEGLNKPPIVFQAGILYEGAALRAMRDRVCLPLARRWLAEVPTRPVAWTKRLRFLPGGLEYTAGGLLSRAAQVTVPYHLTSYRIENGVFKLFVVGEAGAVFKEVTFGPNFFVGLAALNLLYDAESS